MLASVSMRVPAGVLYPYSQQPLPRSTSVTAARPPRSQHQRQRCRAAGTGPQSLAQQLVSQAASVGQATAVALCSPQLLASQIASLGLAAAMALCSPCATAAPQPDEGSLVREIWGTHPWCQ